MIVVADTSVLVNLCRVGQVGLFKSLFREVVIPPEVAAEFFHLTATLPRFAGLKLPDGIREQAPKTLSPLVRAAAGLDAGEAAALSLAIEIKADAVLLDERRGYEVAVELGLHASGWLAFCCAQKTPDFWLKSNPSWTRCGVTRIFGFPNRCGKKFCGWPEKFLDWQRRFHGPHPRKN